MKQKLFTLLTLALFFCSGAWAEDATFTMSSIFNGSNTSATVTTPVDATISTTTNASNADDGKLGSDGNYFQVILTSRTFSAASINGYINTTDTSKNWGFQFTTDGGSNWSAEVTQANDGNKTAHDIAVGVSIPSGANGIRVIRRAGTSTIVNSITLTLGAAVPTHTVTLDKNGGTANGSATASEGSKKLTSISAPTYAGYTVAGYYKEKECTNLIADASGNLQASTDYTNASSEWTSTSDDITLYAKWSRVAQKVLYSLTAGIGSAEGTAGTYTVTPGELLSLGNTAGRIKLTAKTGEEFKNGDNISFTGTVGSASDLKTYGIYYGPTTDLGKNIKSATKVNAASEPSTVNGTLDLDAATGVLYIARYDGTTTNITSLVISRPVAGVDVTVSSAGYATYVDADNDLDFTGSSIKAYKVQVTAKGTATATKVDNVPANTPVLLYKEGGATEAIPIMTGATDDKGNDLVAGTGAAVPTTDGEGNTNMILNNVGGNVGFYFANGQTVASNRAYLHFDSSYAPDPEARMNFVFDDEENGGATGIKTLTTNVYDSMGAAYNLNGQRVNANHKGIVIVNGKKYFNK